MLSQEVIGLRNRVRELTAEARTAEQKMNRAKNELAAIQNSCQHDWFPMQYEPIVREGYQDPGDPEGTMGIDRRLPSWVPRQETPRWTRECRNCGLVQITTRLAEEVKKVPVF